MNSKRTPRRGEIWKANLGDPPRAHRVLIVSLDSRNLSEGVESVLIVPFGSMGKEGPTVMKLDPGETNLPVVSYLKGHFITTLPTARLVRAEPRPFSQSRMREVCALIRRAFDPDAPWEG
ncbi:MAG: type II toxin-antitoxin system PemK/MazF family toxin [Candidatus Acidiferrales bacterium]